MQAQQIRTVFTVCSHTFTLFWSRKTSVIIETFQLSFRVFMCAFHPKFSRVSSFISYFFCEIIHKLYIESYTQNSLKFKNIFRNPFYSSVISDRLWDLWRLSTVLLDLYGRSVDIYDQVMYDLSQESYWVSGISIIYHMEVPSFISNYWFYWIN